MNPRLFRDCYHLAAYFSLFIVNTYLLITLTPWWLKIPLIIVQGFFILGLVEMHHQATHQNLVENRKINSFFGYFSGMLLGVSFHAYKRLHILHHATTDTAADPEKHFHDKPYPTWLCLLLPMLALQRYNAFVNKGTYLANNAERRVHRLTVIFNMLAQLAIIAAIIFYFDLLLFPLVLPVLAFSYIEFFVSQSQHYFSIEGKVAPRGTDHYRHSMNLGLPAFLSYICLYTNHHATHHAKASIRWYDIPEKSAEDAALITEMGFLAFILTWLKGGVRQWRTHEFN